MIVSYIVNCLELHGKLLDKQCKFVCVLSSERSFM